MKVTNSVKILLLSGLSALLLGCASSQPQQTRSLDAQSARQQDVATLTHALEQQGVQVAQMGEKMRIILPSDKLFNSRSANLSAYALPVLDNVSQLMLTLETTSAEVGGYTNLEYSPEINRSLSESQARTVVDYLWAKGVDARLLYAVGYGAVAPLQREQARVPINLNRRIEIQFQYLPLPVRAIKQ